MSIADAPSSVRFHPGTAEIYKRKVENLAETLNEPSIASEAGEIIRSLIERIDLSPTEVGLKAELYGDVAEILALCDEQATKTKRPSYKGMGRRVSVVAGGRYQRCLHLNEVWL